MEIGVEPGEISLTTSVGKEICKEVTLYSSAENTLFIAEDRWSDLNSEIKVFTSYLLSGASVGINLNIPAFISVSGEQQIVLCFQPTKSGIFEGVVVFITPQNKAGVGVWVHITASLGIRENTLKESENIPRYMAELSAMQTLLLGFFLLLLVHFSTRHRSLLTK